MHDQALWNFADLARLACNVAIMNVVVALVAPFLAQWCRPLENFRFFILENQSTLAPGPCTSQSA